MLNNQIKQNIFFSFVILAIFIFGIIIPTKASADIPGYVTPYGGTNYNNNPANDSQYYYPNYYQAPVYVPAPAPVYVNPAPTPIVYSNTTNPNAKVATASKKVAAKNTNTATDTNSNLVASTIFGTNGLMSFMPSGLVQWIFFAILVLLAVILVRKIYDGSEKYYAAPMKHD